MQLRSGWGKKKSNRSSRLRSLMLNTTLMGEVHTLPGQCLVRWRKDPPTPRASPSSRGDGSAAHFASTFKSSRAPSRLSTQRTFQNHPTLSCLWLGFLLQAGPFVPFLDRVSNVLGLILDPEPTMCQVLAKYDTCQSTKETVTLKVM